MQEERLANFCDNNHWSCRLAACVHPVTFDGFMTSMSMMNIDIHTGDDNSVTGWTRVTPSTSGERAQDLIKAAASTFIEALTRDTNDKLYFRECIIRPLYRLLRVASSLTNKSPRELVSVYFGKEYSGCVYGLTGSAGVLGE